MCYITWNSWMCMSFCSLPPLPTFRQILISKHRKITFRRRVNKLVSQSPLESASGDADKILFLLLVAWDFSLTPSFIFFFHSLNLFHNHLSHEIDEYLTI